MLEPLRSLFPQQASEIYIEPFCGSATVYFDTKPQRAILADLNADLINFYTATKKQPEEVFECSSKLKRNKTVYLRIRQRLHDESDPIRRAAFFYFLNRNCFNGLYRTNKAGHFNVPFSNARTGRMLTRHEFLNAAKLLTAATFNNSDFEPVIRNNLGPSKFFFLDPPYAVKRRRPFTEYTGNSFGNPDLERLLTCLKLIDDSGGRFALTYDRTRAKEFQLRSTWSQRQITVRRNISGFASARRSAVEVVTMNYAPC